jgi:hypothetical protein
MKDTGDDLLFTTSIAFWFYIKKAVLLLGVAACLLYMKVNIAGFTVIAILLFLAFVFVPARKIRGYRDRFFLVEQHLLPVLDREEGYFYTDIELVKFYPGGKYNQAYLLVLLRDEEKYKLHVDGSENEIKKTEETLNHYIDKYRSAKKS